MSANKAIAKLQVKYSIWENTQKDVDINTSFNIIFLCIWQKIMLIKLGIVDDVGELLQDETLNKLEQRI